MYALPNGMLCLTEDHGFRYQVPTTSARLDAESDKRCQFVHEKLTSTFKSI